jgi:para-nitrobenzyl esterase
MDMSSNRNFTVGRRQALLGATAAGFGLSQTGEASALEPGTVQPHVGFCTTPQGAIAQTQYGPVRGYVDTGVYTFKGIPYGDDTGGENRWLPAKPPKRWTEPYNALAYGANCPQTLHNFRAKEHTFLQQWDDGFLGEDMLKLNVWTPSLSGSRPVMVYFHGGGFAFGSSYELASQDGAQMARNHDVVQVSVNHRLNILGFFDVSQIGGAGYEDSVNVGMTDLVASLRWVQENISRFGGDPSRVMIYGQSGGGSKVTCLLGMPSTKGLIHRASIQSGGGGNSPAIGQSRELAQQTMIELGLGPKDIGALQKMEWGKLFAAGTAAATKINGPARGPGGLGAAPVGPPRVGWGPTVDGRSVTMRSYFDAVSDNESSIPVLIGSVSEEGMSYGQNPTEVEWRITLAKNYGAEKGNALADAMKRAHPEKSIRTLSYGVGGYGQRNNVQRMVKLKYEKRAAPIYQYSFAWQSPQLDGQCGAWHTAELAFCFDNVTRCAQGTGNTSSAQSVGKKMSTAWGNFARTGDPSQPGLAWAPSDPNRVQTMVFSDRCRMEDDPDGAVRHILMS